MRRSLIGLATCAILATPAAAYRAQNGLRVSSRDGVEGFVVEWSGLSGATEFWCAAGDFAIQVLGLPTTTHLFRYSAPPRRSGEGIAFGFDPARAQRTGLVRLQGGRSLTAAYARHLCDIDDLADR